MSTGGRRSRDWSPGWMLLLLLPAAMTCSSRGAAIYRQTREPQQSVGDRAATRGWATDLAGQTRVRSGDEAEGRSLEPLPRAQARIGGPFLILGDDLDLSPVSINDVESTAAGFDVPEPQSYKGELEQEVEESLYPSKDVARRRRIQDALEMYGKHRPFRPPCANCLLRPHTVRSLTPAPPINAVRAREMARRQQQRAQDDSPYMYVIELVHNVTEEHLPAPPPVMDEHGKLRRLVKEEDVLRKVDIRIEEGWDKEAFEHRGWNNWDWLNEHYGGEDRRYIAGNNQLQLGFEPTLTQMIAEMLRAGKATPDELQAALQALVRRKSTTFDRLQAKDTRHRQGANDENLPRDEIRTSERNRVFSTEDERPYTRHDRKDSLLVQNRAAAEWHQGRAPWARSKKPWKRHGRLMSEFENPDDVTPLEIPEHAAGTFPHVTGRTPEAAANDVGIGQPPDISGPPRWFADGRPIIGNEGRLKRFLEQLISRQSRNAASSGSGTTNGESRANDRRKLVTSDPGSHRTRVRVKQGGPRRPFTASPQLRKRWLSTTGFERNDTGSPTGSHAGRKSITVNGMSATRGEKFAYRVPISSRRYSATPYRDSSVSSRRESPTSSTRILHIPHV